MVLIPMEQFESGLKDYVIVLLTEQITSQTVWGNTQRALLTPPTAPSGYKFLTWYNYETVGSVNAGYISNPTNQNTYVYLPNLTTNVNVVGAALYIRNY